MENRKRPCLYYYIKRCPAPCVGEVDGQEYAETIRRVTMFLKGRGSELIKSLRDRMELLSAERRYEEAARIRDQIHSIQSVLEKQRITSPQRAQRDAFAVYRRDERMVIQTINVRDGEISGGESHSFGNVVLSTSEHVASFISQYYQAGAPVPEEIIVEEEIGEQPALVALLSDRRGRPVRIVHPRRGEKAKLLEMAQRNALVAFEDGGGSERNRELLEDLQELLSLGRYPRRIECYDISNIQGTDAVGSGVTFIDGEPSKAHYRHYSIKTVRGSDDYAMMREVLERRISRGIKEGDLPDMLLIDGGRGQLGVGLDVIQRLGADEVVAVGIAKVREGEGKRRVRGKERIYTADLAEPLLLEGNSPALYLLERIRDEAHRFAITHHRRRRSKRVAASALDGIPGVGPVLKQRLLAEFGSVARIRGTPIEVLEDVQGMSVRLAQAVHDALR
jgi:excinuclease ABC subunit C